MVEFQQNRRENTLNTSLNLLVMYESHSERLFQINDLGHSTFSIHNAIELNNLNVDIT